MSAEPSDLKKIKILFVGDLNLGTRSLLRSQNLNDLGHEVDSISFVKLPFVQGIDKLSFLDRVLWKLKIPIDFLGYNKKIISHVKEKHYDVLWIDKGVYIYPWILKSVRQLQPQIKILSCSEDDMFARHNQTLWYLKGLPLYDMVFTTKVYNLEELKKLGARKTKLFLDSFDQNLHRPMSLSSEDRLKYGCDVGFIGTYEPDRAEKMLHLANNGIVVTIYGNGWQTMVGHHPNLIVKNQPLYADEYVKFLNAAKINLCFLRKINRDQVTSRSVEIPACGGFMLGERTGRHLDFFSEGSEAEFFGDEVELLEKAKFYLTHEQKRVIIAKNGNQRCQQSGYSMRVQVSEILKNTVSEF